MKPMFSILTCTYNSGETLAHCLDSIIGQEYENWEVIVLDNGSKDNTLEILKEYERNEERIRVTYGTQNIGWCKGISECLKIAQGKYMMFIGADDYLPEKSNLCDVAKAIEEHEPDIVWTGFESAIYDDSKYKIQQCIIPEYRVWTDEDIVEKLKGIMSSVYYNSVMHYVRIEFLKEINVDFYEPFYGDCQGMTEALCRAEKMVVLDKAAYVLTANTSQTAKATIYGYNLTKQWESIRNRIGNLSKVNQEDISYIASRVALNMVGMCESILMGGELRDLYMNSIQVGFAERFCYIEKWLESDLFMEMICCAGKGRFEEQLIGAAGVLYLECKKNGNISEEICRKSRWLVDLVEEVMIRDASGQLQWRKPYEEEEFHRIIMQYRTGE